MSPEKKRPPYLRVVRPEDEDRRTDSASAPSSDTANGPSVKRPGNARNAAGDAKSSRVESLPDGENEAEREAAKARDD
jgi:hypothetical protein